MFRQMFSRETENEETMNFFMLSVFSVICRGGILFDKMSVSNASWSIYSVLHTMLGCSDEHSQPGSESSDA